MFLSHCLQNSANSDKILYILFYIMFTKFMVWNVYFGKIYQQLSQISKNLLSFAFFTIKIFIKNAKFMFHNVV